jgi:hypothetical protein
MGAETAPISQQDIRNACLQRSFANQTVEQHGDKAMRTIFVTAIAAAGILAGATGAFAQTVGVEVYSGPRYDPYYYDRFDARPAPRVYGYYRDDDQVSGRVFVRPGNCGEFRYWDGMRCADARVDPPTVR